MPGKEELKEFFLLHEALAQSTGVGQLTEFWKSAPSLLTFLDGQYAVLRALKTDKTRVPRALLTPATEVETLARRNHRISRVVDLSLGGEEGGPRLATTSSARPKWQRITTSPAAEQQS
jgi:hypothetical protein